MGSDQQCTHAKRTYSFSCMDCCHSNTALASVEVGSGGIGLYIARRGKNVCVVKHLNKFRTVFG